MSFVLTIGGQAYTWKPGTLSITETLGGRSTCEFSIDDADGALAAPIVGHQVILLDGAYRIFGGSVETLEIVRYPGIAARVFRVSCVDYHRTLDRRLAGKYSWQEKTAGSIVVDIATSSLQGEAINLNFIQAGPTIQRFEIDYPTVAEAVQQVAQLAKMFWTVDYDRELRFFTPDSYACPFELTPTSKNFTGLALRSTREQYANRVISRIGQYVRDAQTARFDINGRTGSGEDPIPWMKPDGSRKRWAVTYPIHAKPVIRVNGVEKTVGVQGADVADWLWTASSSEVQQDPQAAAIGAADVLEIEYVGLSSSVIAVQNTAEVNLRSTLEQNSGFYEVLKDASTEMTGRDANQFAAAILDSLDELSGVATLQTTGLIEPLASTARVGQRIHIDVGGYRAGGRAINAVAYGSPCVITAPGHGRRNGEKVHLTGVQNLSGTWVIANVTADTFQLVGSNASGSYSGGGWVYPCTFLIRQIRVSDIPGFAEMAYSLECVLGPITADAVSFFRDLAVVQGVPPAAPAPTDPGQAVAPDQPAATDWTISNPAAGDYRADASGAQFVRLTPAAATVPATADYVEFWLYRGPARPADPGLWESIGTRTAAGAIESWQRQPEGAEASTWCVCATASTNSYRGVPTATTPLKTLTVALVGLPPAITGAGVALQASPDLIGGKQLYRLKYTATAPTSDLNYLATRIYARWTDAAWTPLAGDDGTWKLVSGPETFPAYSGDGYDFPAPDSGTQYRQFVFVPINHGLQENWAGAPIVNTSWAADGGFDARTINGTTLGVGIKKDSAGRPALTVRDALLNGDFEFGLQDWLTGGSPTVDMASQLSGLQCCKLTAATAYQFIYQDIPWRPGEVARLTAMVRTTANGTHYGSIQFMNAARSAILAYTQVPVSAVGSYLPMVTTLEAPAGTAWIRVVPYQLGADTTSGSAYIDLVSLDRLEPLSGGLSRTSAGVGIPDGGVSAAKFAATIEPVGLVTATANAAGELLIAKTQSSVYNSTDGKLYRWSVDRYKRPMSGADVKEQLSLDKLTAGQISAGAIGTTELSAVEILVGGGTGKPPRFKVVDAVGTMIGFIGDYGDGFVGAYLQRLRVAPAYSSSQRIEASSAGVALENVPLSMTGSAADVAITAAGGLLVTAKGTWAGATMQMNSRELVAAYAPYSQESRLGFSGLLVKQNGWFGVEIAPPASGSGGRVVLSIDDVSGTLGLTSDSSSNRITSPRPGSYISFSGAGGYINSPEYRVQGNANPVIDANRNVRWHTYYTENLVLSGLTATRWVPAYDVNGNYLGKIPIIP